MVIKIDSIENEENEIIKRWFFVKDIALFKRFMRVYLMYVSILFFASWMCSFFWAMIIPNLIGIFSWVALWLSLLFTKRVKFLIPWIISYITIGKLFFTDTWVLALNSFLEITSLDELNWIKLNGGFKESETDLRETRKWHSILWNRWVMLLLWNWMWQWALLVGLNTIGITLNIDSVVIFNSIVYIWLPLIFFITKKLVEYFHPLYAFWNLWSKIQSLTPTIEKKSREIEANFRENMDFGKLRNGFSDLSASLAKVSEYIVKLEQAEKKANKWNLFDSVKYIGSLKWDIVKPLVALRSFLSTRVSELEKSKGEMQKVRVKVGWWEEALSLQSARTEPLIAELKGNIEKLDGMIEKL